MYTYIYAGRPVYLYTFIHTSIAISAQVRSAQVRRAALQQFLTMSTPARRVRAKKTTGLAALANGVKTLNALQENDDLNYIIAELKGPKRKLVQSVATLLRSGQLEKEEIVAQDGLGARIKKGVSSYKGLGAKFLMAFLRRACPHWSEADLKAMSNDRIMDVGCFALGVLPTTKLPVRPGPARPRAHGTPPIRVPSMFWDASWSFLGNFGASCGNTSNVEMITFFVYDMFAICIARANGRK